MMAWHGAEILDSTFKPAITTEHSIMRTDKYAWHTGHPACYMQAKCNIQQPWVTLLAPRVGVALRVRPTAGASQGHSTCAPGLTASPRLRHCWRQYPGMFGGAETVDRPDPSNIDTGCADWSPAVITPASCAFGQFLANLCLCRASHSCIWRRRGCGR